MLSYSVMQISLLSPASQEPVLPPTSVLLHPSQARLTVESLTTGAQPIFPYQWLKEKKKEEKGEKKKKRWFSGITGGKQAGVPWPGRRWAAACLVALGTFTITISNRLEVLNNLPSLPWPWENRKSRVEQKTFEYLRPTHSRLCLHFLFSKRLVRMEPSLLIRP